MIYVPAKDLSQEIKKAQESKLYTLVKNNYSILIRAMDTPDDMPVFLIGTHHVFLSRFTETGGVILVYCRKCQNQIQLKNYHDFYSGEGDPDCENYLVAEILSE